MHFSIKGCNINRVIDDAGTAIAPQEAEWEESALHPDEPQPQAAVLPKPVPSLRLLPADLCDREPFWKRRLFEVLAITVTAMFFYFVMSYWAPAHPGVDQNGYLVGGKQIALAGSSGFQPANPLEYIGSMWVITGDLAGTGDGKVWYYPKYPIGLPLLYAIPLWINWDMGKDWAFLVSPVCAAFSLLGMFMLVRTVAGSFMGIMGMILLGMNVTTLALANNPNSHASALCFVVWGMFMLLRWWQTGTVWRGLMAGFLLGFAVTIRYTEGLLLLPLAVAVACIIPYSHALKLSWWRLGVVVLIAAGATALRLRVGNTGVRGMALVVGLLMLFATIPWWQKKRMFRSIFFWRGLAATALVTAIILLRVPDAWKIIRDDTGIKWSDSYELQALIIMSLTALAVMLFIYAPRTWLRSMTPIMGWMVPVLWLTGFNWFAMHTITGYDTTNESTAFTPEGFQAKWEFMVSQLYEYGAFFILPLTVLGLVVMWRWSARVAMAAMLWLLPGVLLYTAYYWGNGNNGLGYLRFFLTLVPAMILPAVWFLYHGGWWQHDVGEGHHRRGSVLMPIGCGVFVALVACMAIRNSLSLLERDVAINNNLAFTGEQIVKTIPAGSLVFTDQRGGYSLMNYLQWKGDYQLFSGNAFGGGRGGGGGGGRGFQGDPEQPRPLQGARVQYMRDKVLAGKNPADLAQQRNSLIRGALEGPQPRRVFLIVPTATTSAFLQIFTNRSSPLDGGFLTKQVNVWKEPAAVSVEASLSPLMPTGRGLQVNRQPLTWQIHEVVGIQGDPLAQPQPERGRGGGGGRGGRGGRGAAAGAGAGA